MNLEKGIFTLSLDLELAWGSFDRKNFNPALFYKTRDVIKLLLKLGETYQIPMTWAVVGHLFLKECFRENGIAHPEMPRPRHQRFAGDWYGRDPCSDLSKEPAWYGADIIEIIRSSSVAHEIGSHSFSHCVFADSGCAETVAEAELKKCVQLASAAGLKLKSFVFPKNQEAYCHLLPRYGFEIYRGLDPTWFNRLPRSFRLLGHIIDYLFIFPAPTSQPRETILGLWNIPGSMVYLHRNGLRGLIPMRCRVQKALKGIERAIKKKEVFHLWFHPFNIASDPPALLRGLEIIFAYARQKKKENLLDILTMGGIVERMKR